MTPTSRLQRTFPRRALVAAGLAVAALTLSGCGSTIADHMPTAVGGPPGDSPRRPAAPASYPAVHDMPPPRPTSVLTDEEQQKLENDLIATRNRAAEAAKAAAENDKP